MHEKEKNYKAKAEKNSKINQIKDQIEKIATEKMLKILYENMDLYRENSDKKFKELFEIFKSITNEIIRIDDDIKYLKEKILIDN